MIFRLGRSINRQINSPFPHMSPSIHKQMMTQSFSNIPLCSNIQKSTFPHQPKAGGPPFSPERSFVLAIFPLVIFCILIFIEENIPLTPCKTMCFTPPQESNLDSCRPMSPSAYRPESCKATLADNEHQLISTIFPSPTLSVEVMMVCTSCSST